MRYLSLMTLLMVVLSGMATAYGYADKAPFQPVEYISFWDDNYPVHLSSHRVDAATKPSSLTIAPKYSSQSAKDDENSVLEEYSELIHLGGTPVISSPFVNMYENYSGSDLIVNYSSINKDLATLRQRKSYENLMFNKANVKRVRLPLKANP